MKKKSLIALALGLCLLLVYPLAWWALKPSYNRKLDQAKDAWRAQGFKLDFSEFQLAAPSDEQRRAAAAVTNVGFEAARRFHSIPATPGRNNEATVPFMAAREMIARMPFTPMEPVTENHALAISRLSELPVPGEEWGSWAFAREILQLMEPSLGQARRAVGDSSIRFDLNLGRVDIRLPHLGLLPICGQLFSLATLTGLHDKDQDYAWANLEGLVKLITGWQVEPFESAHLHRGESLRILYPTLWEALAVRGWTEEQLSDLQTSLEKLDLMEGLAEILALERPITARMIEAARSEQASRSLLAEARSRSSGLTDLGPNIWRTWKVRSDQHTWKSRRSYVEELLILSNYVHLEVEVNGAVQDGSWLKLEGAFESLATNSFRWVQNPGLRSVLGMRHRFPHVYPRLGNGRGAAGALALAEARRRLMITALAMERYRLVHQDLPGSLSALVPVFVAAVPLDPFDEQPLRYRATPNGDYLLWSAGPNRTDNGGKQPQRALSGIKPDFTNADLVWPAPILELTKPN